MMIIMFMMIKKKVVSVSDIEVLFDRGKGEFLIEVERYDDHHVYDDQEKSCQCF